MTHSKNYETVKNLYDRKLWSIDRVWNMVGVHWITEEEYFEITGFVYPAKE